MRRYGYIVNKQFSVNKKRNISTILGIILSIILFTTVGYIQAYYRDINIEGAKTTHGNYEAVFKDISSEKAEILKNNIYVKDIALYKNIYKEKIEIDGFNKWIYLYEIENTILTKSFNTIFKLDAGRLPEAEGELLIDNISSEILNKTIGDILTLGNETYIIVGVYKADKDIQFNNISLITYFDKEDTDKSVNAIINTTKDKNKYLTIKKIASDLGISRVDDSDRSKVSMNELLFYYYGERIDNMENISSKVTEYSLYIVILVLTIFLTYGSINVSIKERIEQFSILRCIGATPSKIRRLLVKESILLSLLSIIPGIIIGQIICYIMTSIIMVKMIGIDTYGITYKFYPEVIVIVTILTILTIFIATIIPIIKIGKIEPIEGLKEGVSIPKGIKKRSSKVVKRFFGYNGELAYKNIRANNRNFIITTITSIIILTTFIVFTGYNNNIVQSFNEELNIDKDMELDINNLEKINYNDIPQVLERYKREVEALNVADKVFTKINYAVSGVFEDVKLNKWIKEREERVIFRNKESVYNSNINIVVMDDETLEEIIKDQKLDITLEDFKDNGVLILDRTVLKNYINVEKEHIFNLKKGENFSLYIKNNTELGNDSSALDEEIKLIDIDNKKLDFKYLGSIDGDKIMNGNRYGYTSNTTLIASKYFNKSLKENMRVYSINLILELKSNINRELAVEKVENYASKNQMFSIDNKEGTIELINNMKVISGIIHIILLLTIIVGGVNIINNKIINIKLRGKEIGTLLAIGISKKRLRKILMLEAVVQWLIATIVSISLSYIILTIIFEIMRYTLDITTSTIPIKATIFGVVILLVINVVGVYLPIKKLRYTDTTELIRNRE